MRNQDNIKDGMVELYKYDDIDKMIETIRYGNIRYIRYLKKEQKKLMGRKDGYAYIDYRGKKAALFVYDKTQDRTARRIQPPTDDEKSKDAISSLAGGPIKK